MKLIWTPKMVTGIASLDSEHYHLIVAHNDLLEALEGEGNGELADSLERLLAMTQGHFLHEEDLMRRTDFPDLVRHEADHDLIITEFYNTRHRLLGGVVRTVDPQILAQFRRWFLGHLVDMDFDYVAHFRDHGVE